MEDLFLPPHPPFLYWTQTKDVNEKQMCRRVWGEALSRLCFHKELRLRGTRKSPNLDLLDQLLCMRHHPGKWPGEIRGRNREADRRGNMDRCVQQTDRAVCVGLIRPAEKGPHDSQEAYLGQILLLAWELSIRSHCSSSTVPPPPAHTHPHTLPPAPPPLTCIWLAAACGIHPHGLAGPAGCWVCELKGRQLF